MSSNISNSPIYNLVSKQLNLSNFDFKIFKQNRIKTVKNKNKLLKFIKNTFNYAKITLNKYSNEFSKHSYTQHALFTIISLKIYTKSTYREIIDLIELSDQIKRYLRIKKVPHFTTIQKYFKRLSSTKLKEINRLILTQNEIQGEIIALDGSGFTNDYADKYYAIIRKKERKSYIKNHIAIDVKTRLILDYTTQRGPKYDTTFAIQSIRNIKKYKPHYILADRAYDTEPIRKCINEEINAFDQIPLKTRAKKGHYRLNSPTIFRHKIYRKRNNVESVFSVIKRKFSG
ncbi:transposase, partial [Methanobrevibacter sp. OttesenSCG-928-K11]|nr:transposase [Methanobrevibacter sp. OttesenSCG-928-K11]